ncbi:hypothetical protein [Devosia lucknowensis]|uniref:hypothetical protein n=1 Tax=Devosia lucknowensis TaxID=1096929 RepID=UPI00111ED02E|nr:hypothetical protein [Devosia lucknowensis]
MRPYRQIFVLAAILATTSIASAQESSDYDPSPFLTSLIGLRAAAVTCEPFVANSPASRTESVVEFFASINQTLPSLVDTETQASLNRFIGSQAASLCRDKLDASFNAYGVQLQNYNSSKPEEWPAAPEISRAPWCSSENCLEF